MVDIVICPGHYESYKGVEKNGLVEYDICSNIVDHIISYSKTLPDVFVHSFTGTLINKINKINELKPSLAIEVHLGNSNNIKIRGTRSFFMINSDISKKLADTLVSSCVNNLDTPSKGSWVGWFKKIGPKLVKEGRAPADWKPKIDIFLSKTECTSAIIEPFFISSQHDCVEYNTEDKLQLIAKAILNGAIKHTKEQI
jgi:N-acetylmuramoyl-L-alanine amidase